jgi:uncharacterized protein YndB with AHSA1/START domain
MEKNLLKDAVIPAGVRAVWEAWTTVKGVQTFFAPEAKIELAIGGAYEMYFMLDAPEGFRGSEGCTVIEFEPEKRLAFTWNFPPHLEIRGEHTRVEIRLSIEDETNTKLEVRQTGWGEGKVWEEGFQYFDRAWALVLDRLKRTFEAGPIDWSDPDS